VSRRHYDRALRVLVNAHEVSFYLRDLGGRSMASQHLGRGFEAVDALVDLGRARFRGEAILISMPVMQVCFLTAIDNYVLRFKLRPGLQAHEWVTAFRARLDVALRKLGYVSGHEYDAVRAIMDAGEVETLPDFLESLAAIKPA
jgi:hypothetical protein